MEKPWSKQGKYKGMSVTCAQFGLFPSAKRVGFYVASDSGLYIDMSGTANSIRDIGWTAIRAFDSYSARLKAELAKPA